MPLYTGLAAGLFFAGLGLPGLCGFIGEVFVVLSTWAYDRVFAIIAASGVILTAGYNVYPAELERVIAAHPAVALVAVGPRTDELKGEIAKAYIVLKDGVEGNAEDIVTFCRSELAAYKVPREIQFVADLPKTSTGKVMRRELHTLDVT